MPATSRRRDPINLAATLKPCEDGLVDVDVLPDDTPTWLQPTPPVIHPAQAQARCRLYLIVRELPGVPVPTTTAPGGIIP